MLSIMFQNKIFFQEKPAVTEVYEKNKKKKKDSLHEFSISALLFRII